MPRRVHPAHTAVGCVTAIAVWLPTMVLTCVAVAESDIDPIHPTSLSGTVSPSNPAMANVPGGPTIPTLRRVDSALDARDPLANSLRNPQVDLASPLDFRDLYAVEGRDDVFVRRSGAVYAVFPRAYYVKPQQKQGQAPKEVSRVPGGTTYSIGFPSALKIAPARGGPAPRGARLDCAIDSAVEELACPGRIEQRVALGAGQSPAARATSDAASAPSDPLPRFVVNESYRRARIDALLRAAGG